MRRRSVLLVHRWAAAVAFVVSLQIATGCDNTPNMNVGRRCSWMTAGEASVVLSARVRVAPPGRDLATDRGCRYVSRDASGAQLWMSYATSRATYRFSQALVRGGVPAPDVTPYARWIDTGDNGWLMIPMTRPHSAFIINAVHVSDPRAVAVRAAHVVIGRLGDMPRGTVGS